MSYPIYNIPSLQGTSAKRTKPALRPNFAKEPFHPSRSKARLRDRINLIDKKNENINLKYLTLGSACDGLVVF